MGRCRARRRTGPKTQAGGGSPGSGRGWAPEAGQAQVSGRGTGSSVNLHKVAGLLQPLAQDLWIQRGPLRHLGVEYGRVGCLIRLRGGDLVLITPGPLRPDLAAEIAALGPLRHLVANNLFHNLFLADWLSAFPGALCHAVPGFQGRYGLRVDRELGAAPPDARWAEALQELPVEGMPKVGEWLLLHRPSGSLIVGDLLFNLPAPRGWREAAMQRLLGLWGGPARGRRYPGFVSDPRAFEASLERALQAGFERLIPAHGEPIEAGAMAALRRVWRLPAG